jgi:signal transduction histidine kinase
VQMKEVFTNILINAFEAVEETGGYVSVTSRIEKDGGPAVIFEDSGRGMGKEELKNIFSPFWTTKARGNGLGLTVAESIVKMHGGRIEASGKEGEGSTFSVFLPPELVEKAN